MKMMSRIRRTRAATTAAHTTPARVTGCWEVGGAGWEVVPDVESGTLVPSACVPVGCVPATWVPDTWVPDARRPVAGAAGVVPGLAGASARAGVPPGGLVSG
ncbi:exported hypothetical protein [Arthrobacter sp. 9AX]|nr:exported hypothetical protein [Arthrobacter sp. 9AX]